MKTSLRFCGGVTALVALGTILYEPDAVADSDVTNDCQVRGEIPTNSRPADGGGPFSINIGGIQLGGGGGESGSTGGSRQPSGRSGESGNSGRGGGAGIGFSIDPAKILKILTGPGMPRQLAEAGPQLQHEYSMSCMSVRGFVKGGWPMVLDYESDGASMAAIEIHAEGAEKSYVYQLEHKQQRQIVKFELPLWLGDTPRPALVLVRALKDQPGEIRLARMRVYGIGTGPRAVGSVAIDQVEFVPAAMHVAKHEVASYSFFSRSDFNRIAVEIMRLQNSEGDIRVGLAKTITLKDGVSRGTWIGHSEPLTWDGTDSQGQISLGLHLLQVRAWVGARDEGDWVVAWSPRNVKVSE